MLFCITLGDWLGKGHDIKEDFLYDCNRPAAEIAAAYGMSREKYGVRFDGFKKDDPFAVWTSYGESGMSPEARGRARTRGASRRRRRTMADADRADLVMRFIALSMPAGSPTSRWWSQASTAWLQRRASATDCSRGRHAETKARPATEGGHRRICGCSARRGHHLRRAPHRLAP